MEKNNHKLFTIIYFTIALIAILADSLSLKWALYLSKPLPLLVIFIFYKIHSINYTEDRTRNFMLIAFLFCALGDTLLMFSGYNELFFIAGLVSFLIGHILYTSSFAIEILKSKPWKGHWAQLAFSTLIVVYGAEFYILNRFSFGTLWLPVLIYCCAITAMGVAATMRDNSINRNAFLTVIVGAVLFIISDSLLATNKFISPLPFAGPLILCTYFLGQYAIAVGSLNGKIGNQILSNKN